MEQYVIKQLMKLYKTELHHLHYSPTEETAIFIFQSLGYIPVEKSHKRLDTCNSVFILHGVNSTPKKRKKKANAMFGRLNYLEIVAKFTTFIKDTHFFLYSYNKK